MTQNKFIILDGAMGSLLQQMNVEIGHHPETLSITDSDVIESVHKKYIEAGSDVIYANTFGASEYKLEGCGYTVEEVIDASIKTAKKATEGTNVRVALDIGPTGCMLEPGGTVTFERAYEMFARQIKQGVKSGADLIVIETMTDLYEMKAAVLAAKENSNLPVFATMTFDENMRTFTGVDIHSMALTLGGLGVDAIGLNCSLGPKEVYKIAEKLAKCTDLPLIVKPNAGLPDPVDNTYNITPEEFGEYMSKIIDLGVCIIGGCCGTTPEYIKILKKITENKTVKQREFVYTNAVCSGTKTVEINRVRVIGERINPTGKKRFREAILNGELDYIMKQAIEQVEAGADILDVNLGVPGIDEPEMMKTVIKSLQSITNLPIQIDSSNPAAIEAGLRVYNGKAIVNSVNGEDAVLHKILPLIKKYGAAVVGLTMDENGIPATAEQRVKIAEKIIKTAADYGIPKEDVYIDCLTLTVSAQQKEAMETIRALETVKAEFGVKTVLGVSNISFGLPNREIINQAFLTIAIAKGLDLPIINPNIQSMMSCISAYNVLSNIDENATEFIEKYGAEVKEKPAVTAKTYDLTDAVCKGLEAEAAQLTEKLIANHDPMDIVNSMLIPSLDKVGSDFEKNIIFLPQLLKAAQAAQAAFEVIKKHLSAAGGETVNKGTIAIATVKGDVHDIGKNIVKIILENYGFKVIDLGRDVEIEKVVNCVKENNLRLLGLSALMTTTLKSMEDTITAVKTDCPNCKIMVGGAVLTPEYAKKINADFYAKDAKQSADIAKMIFE